MDAREPKKIRVDCKCRKRKAKEKKKLASRNSNDFEKLKHVKKNYIYLQGRKYITICFVYETERKTERHAQRSWNAQKLSPLEVNQWWKLPVNSSMVNSDFFNNSSFSFRVSSWAKRSSYSHNANFSASASLSSRRLWGSATSFHQWAARKKSVKFTTKITSIVT